MGERAQTKTEFYVADVRPEWRSNPYITFWRPKNCGYAYPLVWSGRYKQEELKPGYHDRKEGRVFIRFAVPCSIVEAIGVAPGPGMIDGNAGPVVLNTAQNRRALRTKRLTRPAKEGG